MTKPYEYVRCDHGKRLRQKRTFFSCQTCVTYSLLAENCSIPIFYQPKESLLTVREKEAFLRRFSLGWSVLHSRRRHVLQLVAQDLV